jgi:peptide/nickel transport system ATP-binding protein
MTITDTPSESATPVLGDVVLQAQDLAVDVRIENEWIRVVENIDFEVRAGATLGLVGESGSGKTLTSLALMGLLPTNARLGSGTVRLKDRTISGLSEREMSDIRGNRVAMIFQEPRRSLNGAFTVGDQIAEVVRRHKKSSHRQAWSDAVEMLDRVGIPEPARRARQYPYEFSGGMCQRVMLAIALACEPDVLIADEPTTALDVTVQRQVLELISDLQAEMGLAVVLITHDLGVVAEVCDDVAVMYAGQIVEKSPVDSVFHDPAHPYTSGLLRSIPEAARRDEALGYIPGLVPPPTQFVQTCRFAPRCEHAQSSCTNDVAGMHELLPGHSVRCLRSEELRRKGLL